MIEFKSLQELREYRRMEKRRPEIREKLLKHFKIVVRMGSPPP